MSRKIGKENLPSKTSKRGISAILLAQNQTPRLTRSSNQNGQGSTLASDDGGHLLPVVAPVANVKKKARAKQGVTTTPEPILEAPNHPPGNDAGPQLVPAEINVGLGGRVEGSVSSESDDGDWKEGLYDTGSSVDLEELSLRFDDSFEALTSSSTSVHTAPIPPIKANTTTGVRKGKKAIVKATRPAIVDTSPFSITIWFVISGCEKDVEVTSLASYVTVKQALADLIEIDVRSLRSLLYKVDKDRSQTSFRDLNEENWRKIVAWARDYRSRQMKRAGGAPDNWSVKVKEAADIKSKGSKIGNRNGKLAPSVVKEAPSLQLQKMAELSRARSCAQHGGKNCWIPGKDYEEIVETYGLRDIGHVQVTDSELAKWVDEMMAGIADSDSPGVLLGRAICKRLAETLREKRYQDGTEGIRYRQNLPQTPSARYAHTFTAPTVPTPVRAQSAPLLMSNPPETQTAPPTQTIGPSRPRYFPLDEWFKELPGRMNGDDTDYPELFKAMCKERIRSTFEILELGVDGMIGIGGLMRGDAARLVGWAKADRDN